MMPHPKPPIPYCEQNLALPMIGWQQADKVHHPGWAVDWAWLKDIMLACAKLTSGDGVAKAVRNKG